MEFAVQHRIAGLLVLAVLGFGLADDFYKQKNKPGQSDCFADLTHKDLGVFVGFMSLFFIVFALVGILAEIRTHFTLRVLGVSFNVVNRRVQRTHLFFSICHSCLASKSSPGCLLFFYI